MIVVRKSIERGHTQTSWLKSAHTFSFGEYNDPEHRGFSWLRVINDDTVAPGGGFAPHSHRDMEIITYVLDGALQHQDSLGNGSIIQAGEVQHMSAGTGIRHSEFNASEKKPVHFLQIWVIPSEVSIPPSYSQKSFPVEGRMGKFQLVVSPDGRDDSIIVHQDVDIYLTQLTAQDHIGFQIVQGRKLWVHVARGALLMNGQELFEGDGVAVMDEEKVEFSTVKDGEFLLFDLP